MQTMDTQVDSGTLTRLDNLIVELFLYLGYHLFNTGRMDTTIADELMKSQTANLTTDRIETRDNDSLRGVINHNLNACCCLEGTDVTTFTTDNTTLHLIVVDMEHTDGVLNGCLSSYTLNRLDNDLLGLGIGIEFCLIHNLVDVTGCGSLSLVFHRLYESGLGILSTQSRYLFEHLALLELHLLQFLSLHGQQFLLIVDTILLVVEFILPTSEFLLTLVQ